MKQTTLQFPSIIEMTDFQLAVQITVTHFNMTDLTVTASFSQQNIELARQDYKALVVQVQEA